MIGSKLKFNHRLGVDVLVEKQRFGSDTTRRLGEITGDKVAHPMTRFEAMGWAVFARHRAAIPKPDDTGAPSAVADVFQFWDGATRPPEIADGKRNWERTAKT